MIVETQPEPLMYYLYFPLMITVSVIHCYITNHLKI